MSTGARDAARLPAWPLLAPFAAYALWWLLGVGDFIWIMAAAVMVVTWFGRRELVAAVPIIIWAVFLLWVVASVPFNDTPGRIIGAVYRLLLYASAGVFAVHVYSARGSLPAHRVTRAMVWFLVGMTACGYLAMAAPELVIRTPMSYVTPGFLKHNDLIADMVIRRTSQWNPDAWVAQDVRPAAPFLYANTWGNVYSLVLPLVLLHAWFVRNSPRMWGVLAIALVSLPPALATLNRGMFIGLGVVAVWVGLQALRRGAMRAVRSAALGFVLIATAWYFSPLGASFFNRVATTNSTDDRWALYRTTWARTLESPLFGLGSPRPAEYPWLPSLGTQGQLWTVLFSHGIVGLVLFLLPFVLGWIALMPCRDPAGAVFGGVLLATLVETFFYGMMTGVLVSLVVLGLGLRHRAAETQNPLHPASRRTAAASASRAASARAR